MSHTDSKTKAQRWPRLQAVWGKEGLKTPRPHQLGPAMKLERGGGGVEL